MFHVGLKLGDQESPMTVTTPALFVLGRPIKPTDVEVAAFLESHSLDAAGVLTVTAEATLKHGQKIQDLEALQIFCPCFRVASAVSVSTPAASKLCDSRNAATSTSVGLIGPQAQTMLAS